MNAILRALIFAVAACCATSAPAQPKPALVQGRDEPARNAYQQVVSQPVNSSSDHTRTLTFPAVPTGKRLVVTFVNVVLGGLPVAGDTGWAALGREAGTTFLVLPAPVLGYDRVVAMPLTYYYEPGEQPVVMVQSQGWSDGGLVQALLVGHYVTLP